MIRELCQRESAEIVASVDVAAAYTFPFASTPRPEFAREVNHCACRGGEASVVEAFAKCEVEEAFTPFFAQNIEEVAAFTVA